jgi:PAN domain
MDIQIIVLVLIIIFLVSRSPCWQDKESYVNTYGDYIESPFFEDNDRKCRKVCNNMSDCTGYNYDKTKDKCYLNTSGKNYMLPYSDHWLYPNYDPYLYKYGWWLQAGYDNPINDGRERSSDATSINTLRRLQNRNKNRPVMPVDFVSKGYKNTMYMGQNAYHFTSPKNDNVIKFTGSVNGLLGGGHGGRVRGNSPSENEIVYR